MISLELQLFTSQMMSVFFPCEIEQSIHCFGPDNLGLTGKHNNNFGFVDDAERNTPQVSV